MLNANVLVSAILSPQGIPAKVLTAWLGKQFHLALSEAVLDEIDRVLHYPRIARATAGPKSSFKAFLRILPISRS